MIQGGWEFIRAAYILVWVFLGLYSVSLWKRFRDLRKKEGEIG